MNKLNKIALILAFLLLVTVVAGAENNADEAIKAYTEKIKENPNDAEAYFLLGDAYYDKGMYQEAIEAFKQSLNIDKNDAGSYYGIGVSYVKLEQYDKAIEPLKTYTKLVPDDGHGHYDLGYVLLIMSRFEEAIEPFKKSLSLFTDVELKADAHCALCYVYAQNGNFEDSYRECQKALELDPAHECAKSSIPKSCISLGNYYGKQEKYNDSLRVYKECLKLSEDASYLSEVYFKIGVVHFLTDNNKEAVDAFIQSLRNEKSPKAYNNLGLAYEQLGEYRKAYMVFNKASELDPSSKEYRERAERVKEKVKPEDYEIFLDDAILSDIAWTNIICSTHNTIDQNIASRYGDLRNVIADARLGVGLEATRNMQTFCNAIADVLKFISPQQLRKLLYIVGTGMYAIEGKEHEKAARFKLNNGNEIYTLIMTKRLYDYSNSVFISRRSRYPQYAFLTTFLDNMKLSGETKSPLPAKFKALLTAFIKSNTREAIRLIDTVTDKEIAKVMDYCKKRKEEDEKAWLGL